MPQFGPIKPAQWKNVFAQSKFLVWSAWAGVHACTPPGEVVMEVGAGGMVRNDRHIADLRGDPEVEFAKAVLMAAGKYVDPHWTKERLFYELQQISQAAAMSAYLRRAAAEDGEKQQLEHAMMASYRRGSAPQDLLPIEQQDHLSLDHL